MLSCNVAGTHGSLEGQVNPTKMCWREDGRGGEKEGFKEEIKMEQELDR